MFEDTNVPNVGKKEPPTSQAGAAVSQTDAMIQENLDFQRKLQIARAMSGGGQESIGNVVVTKTFDVLEKNNEKTQNVVTQLGADVNAARGETDKAKEALYTMLASQIGGTMAQMEKMRDEIKHFAEQKPAVTKSLLEQLTEVKQIGAIINPQPAGPAAPAPVPDMATTVALRQMEMAHEKSMKQLDIQLEQMRQDLAIRLAEFSDKKVERKEQFESSNKFRSDALATVGDLAAAAAAGLQGKGGVGAQAGGKPAPAAPGGGVNAYVSNFPCQSCGEKIAVPPTGNKATCPSCKVEYDLDRTPGSGNPPPPAPEVPEEEQ